MTDWPSSHHEALKNHLAAGLSASQAAAELNGEFRSRYSRSAVIGHASRTGLAFKRRRSEPPKIAAVPKLATKPLVPRRPRNVSLFELTDDTCRWPISEVGAPDFCFCGNPPVEGLPYCAGHARLAYQPSRPSTRPSYQLRGRA